MNRIDFIASLLKNSDIVLDIGTDHGLVLKKAFKNNYISKAIATDINKGPLSNAKKNLTGYDVQFYLTDGFSNLPNLEYDTVVIAGMGAHLIADILKKAEKDVRYILQANAKHETLRKFLMENNYQITDEHIVFDDFYYVIIEAKLGNMELSDYELYVGPVLKTKPSSKEFYQHKINQIVELFDKLDDSTKERYQLIMNYYIKALYEV